MKGYIISCMSIAMVVMNACNKTEVPVILENVDGFTEVGSIQLAGGSGAAEISAFDPITKRLFTVNNGSLGNTIDVIDLSTVSSPVKIHSINIANYGGFVNSLDIYDGKLAAAIEASVKQNNGKVVVFNTNNYAEIKSITVGALPDMVVYSKDGRYILTANEGEPSNDYLNDPEGTVSIIDVQNNYTATTLNFSRFESQVATLKAQGLRIFGPGTNFVKDIEPEYITVSDDSKTAWVTLQENNAIAKVDIQGKAITNIFPLGFKDYSLPENAIDPSDMDTSVARLRTVPVKGIYMPDAISYFSIGGVGYTITANEGDAREYSAFSEVKRIKSISLDATKFPNAADLKKDWNLGRLNITNTLGDIDGDGDFDELYSFGARSFTIWNAATGIKVYDSKNELDKKAATANVYDDARSDDKSIEPEAVVVGKVGNSLYAFVGLERADAVAIYKIDDPTSPVFIKLLKTGDAPEGLAFIPAAKSPNKKSMLVVSSENDGMVKIFQP